MLKASNKIKTRMIKWAHQQESKMSEKICSEKKSREKGLSIIEIEFKQKMLRRKKASIFVFSQNLCSPLHCKNEL